jgi:putative DNA primase/helicase
MTDTVSAFREEIEQAGLTPPSTIIADGKLHRFASNGDRTDDAGWYVLYCDGLPAGSFGDWRSGVKQNWCVKSDRQMSTTEREELRTRLERARQQREADEWLRHVDAAQRAHAIWNEAAPATG